MTSIQPAPVQGVHSFRYRLWAICAHPILLLTLVFLVMLMGIAYLWLPQLPTSLAEDPIAIGTWLAEQQGNGNLIGVAQALGLYDVAHSNLLRLLLALLAGVLLIRLGNRVWLAQATRDLAPPLQLLPMTSAYDWKSSGSPIPDWTDILQAAAFTRWQPVERDQETSGRSWLADRGQKWTWGMLLIELGLLAALVAVLLMIRQGWQIDNLILNPGGEVSLSPYSDLRIHLDSEGEILSLCCAIEAEVPVADGRLAAEDITLSVNQLAPAMRVTAEAEGTPLLLQAIEQGDTPASTVIVRFPQDRSERAIAIPERNLVLRIVHAGGDSFQVQALDATNTVLISDIITDSKTFNLDGTAIQLDPAQFANVMATRRPWLGMLIAGLVVTGLGLLIRWRYAYMRIGMLTMASGVQLRWQGQRGAQPQLADLVDLIGRPHQADEATEVG